MCFDLGQASGSLQLQGVTAGELSCRTLGMGGFAGSEGCGAVIWGKTIVGWWGLQERWWTLAGLEGNAAGGIGGLCWGRVRAGLSCAAPHGAQFSFSK